MLLVGTRKMQILMIVSVAVMVNAQAGAEIPRTFVRSGRYNPQVFGVSGRYTPDDRGKYRHMPVPYNGGYGDRGEKYTHDDSLRSRYWQQYGDEGRWEEPDSYEDTAPYASSPYSPSSAIPDYIPQGWNPGQHSYAEDYEYGIDGWRIIQFQWSKDGKTRYSYLYETENKILAEEIGKLARLNDSSSAIRVGGLYKYEGDDGTVYKIDYVANENGFYPKGKHVHKSIQNILDYLVKNATKVPA